MNSKIDYHTKRLKLAEIAKREALLQLEGDLNNAGIKIEKYLQLFRNVLNQRLGTTYYSDRKTGFQWCCAFVYFCCLEAGFHFSPQPSDKLTGSLALVSAWREWASLPQNDFILKPGITPKPGDLIVFDCLVSELPLDHIGILLENQVDHYLVAEGNVDNRTGIFKRDKTEKVNSIIRLEKY